MQAGKARQSWGAGAMQQVADWLEKLGLGQYAERFAENDISFAVLPDLTDQHLIPILTLSNPWLPSRGVRWT